MWIRLRRRHGVTLSERYIATACTNPREHNLGRELKEPLAQQIVLVVIQSKRAQKYRSAIRQLIKGLLLRLALENDHVADFVFAHAMLGFNRRAGAV